MIRKLIDIKIEFLILCYDIRDWIMYKIVYALWPEIVLTIVDNTTKFLAPTIPAMSMMQEMRNRGILDYYCYIRIVTHATTGKYSSTEVSRVTIDEVIERFKDSMR